MEFEALLTVIIAALLTGLLTLIGWFTSRVTTKMDEIHKDISTLAINHGERITRLESFGSWQDRQINN